MTPLSGPEAPAAGERPSGDVSVTYAGGVATVWLRNESKRNAVSDGMWRRLAELAQELATDPAVRVVVVRGSGGVFSSGADLGPGPDAADATSPSPAERRSLIGAATNALASLSKPTVAAVEGPCIGGGCAIAVACDLRVAERSARLGIPAARLGVVYPAGDLARLLGVVGAAAARYLLLTSTMVSADRARELGLVHEVYDRASFDERVGELARTLVAQSLLTQCAGNEAINQWLAAGAISDALQRRWEEESDASPDRLEGALALRQGRPAVFGWTHPTAASPRSGTTPTEHGHK